MVKPKMKPESEETPEDELKETPEQQAKEQAEGTEEHDVAKIAEDEGVELPEDFQKEVFAFLRKHGSNKMRLAHMRSKISDKEDELRKGEVKKTPKEFSSEAMPSVE